MLACALGSRACPQTFEAWQIPAGDEAPVADVERLASILEQDT